MKIEMLNKNIINIDTYVLRQSYIKRWGWMQHGSPWHEEVRCIIHLKIEQRTRRGSSILENWSDLIKFNRLYKISKAIYKQLLSLWENWCSTTYNILKVLLRYLAQNKTKSIYDPWESSWVWLGTNALFDHIW